VLPPLRPTVRTLKHPTQRLARSGIRSAAVISGTPLAGPWRGAGPAGPPDPQPAAEGSYAGWLGAREQIGDRSGTVPASTLSCLWHVLHESCWSRP
jgi:hypothetical protein